MFVKPLLLCGRTGSHEQGSVVLDRQATASPGTPGPVALRQGRRRLRAMMMLCWDFQESRWPPPPSMNPLALVGVNINAGQFLETFPHPKGGRKP